MKNLLLRNKKIFGILNLLIAICLFTACMSPDSFLKPENLQNTVRWTALFGIISIGVSFVIMTSGIDLSIGSVVGLVGCILAMAMQTTYSEEDVRAITAMEPDKKTIEVDSDASVYATRDWLIIGKEFYRVESTSGRTIRLEQPSGLDAARIAEAVEGGLPYELNRAYSADQLSEELTQVILRGDQKLHSRTIVIPRRLDSLNRLDQIQFLYEVGIPKSFSIESVERSEESTTIRFVVRPNQTVRSPDVVVLSHRSQAMSTTAAFSMVLGISLLIGLVHGLLITKIKLQPFIVTLCGLLFYRGLSRFITADQKQGFQTEYADLKQMAGGNFLEWVTDAEYVFDIPMPFIYLCVLGIVASIFLNMTIYGRYILALGRNEEAARYSGINTDRMLILSYVICSFCAGVAGILFALDLNSIQPSSHGEFYELYAIAAAVLGGCSLRGGEGTVLGVIIATAVMRVLNNAINLIDGIDTSTEFAIIGLVILAGVTADELVKRVAARRRAAAQARELEA